MLKPEDQFIIDYTSPPSENALERAQQLRDFAEKYSAILPPEVFMRMMDNTRAVPDANPNPPSQEI